MQLNWSSILLDGYKKLSLPRQPSCEDRRVKFYFFFNKKKTDR